MGWQAIGAARRVTADVDGTEIWFETSDAELLPTWEVFGTALLVPALVHGRRLHLHGRVCGQWLGQMPALLRTLHEWWQLPALTPVADEVERPPSPGGRLRRARRARRTALCFTCGVDSFYSALHRRPAPEVFLLGLGYDVPLSDRTRASDLEARVRDVAAQLGRRVVVVRTNLREHPAVRDVPWPWAHGGAVVALGHLLSGDVGRLVVSSSYTYQNHRPWGSHWRIDHRWSSGKLVVEHFDPRRSRYEKIEALAADPVVQRHLQVCWEKTTPTSNCSRCSKCGTTMLVLQGLGVLDAFETFDASGPWTDRLVEVDDARYRTTFQRVLAADGLDPELRARVQACVDRSPAPDPVSWRSRLADALSRRYSPSASR